MDLAVISLVENGAMESKDFITTENYNFRLKPTGARKVVNELSNMLNKKVSYQGKRKHLELCLSFKGKRISPLSYEQKGKTGFC